MVTKKKKGKKCWKTYHVIAGESSRDFEKPKSAVLGDEKREGRECEGRARKNGASAWQGFVCCDAPEFNFVKYYFCHLFTATPRHAKPRRY